MEDVRGVISKEDGFAFQGWTLELERLCDFQMNFSK